MKHPHRKGSKRSQVCRRCAPTEQQTPVTAADEAATSETSRSALATAARFSAGLLVIGAVIGAVLTARRSTQGRQRGW